MSAAPQGILAGRDFKTGDVLFREGEAGDLMYVIQSGQVQLRKDVAGADTTIANLGAGEFVGELAVLRSTAHTATAVAQERTRCLVIGRRELETMVTQDPELAVRFMRGLADRLASAYDTLTLLAHRDTRARLGMALIRHAEASTERRPEGLWIAKRLGDIGDEVAVSVVELGEISKHLLIKQLVRVKRDGILVPDLEKLREFVKSSEGGA